MNGWRRMLTHITTHDCASLHMRKYLRVYTVAVRVQSTPHSYKYLHICTHSYIYLHICTYMYIHICIYPIHIYTYIYLYNQFMYILTLCIQTHTHTHTHTHPKYVLHQILIKSMPWHIDNPTPVTRELLKGLGFRV